MVFLILEHEAERRKQDGRVKHVLPETGLGWSLKGSCVSHR